MIVQENTIPLAPEQFTVVRHFRQHKILTRNDLVALLNVSRSKINKILNALIIKGILVEEAVAESTGGRKPQLIALNPDFAYVVGIHMGATGGSICVANFRGEILETRHERFTIRQDPDELMGRVFAHALAIMDDYSIDRKQIKGIGIGVPAPVDKESGRIVSPAIMLGWEDYSVVNYAQQHFPEAIVQVSNDASLLALGERRVGMGQNHENFIYVKIGTGIGCGIICNGEVYRGANGCSGHIGHVSVDRNGPLCYCGNVGCLEKVAAGPAMAEYAMQAAREGQSQILDKLLSQKNILTAEDVGAAAAQGDMLANDIIVQSGQIIGKVLATLVSFFNPTLVILGGRVSNVAPQLLVTIHRTVLEYSLPLSTQNFTIQRSEIGDTAGTEGAIALALEQLFFEQI